MTDDCHCGNPEHQKIIDAATEYVEGFVPFLNKKLGRRIQGEPGVCADAFRVASSEFTLNAFLNLCRIGDLKAANKWLTQLLEDIFHNLNVNLKEQGITAEFEIQSLVQDADKKKRNDRR